MAKANKMMGTTRPDGYGYVMILSMTAVYSEVFLRFPSLDHEYSRRGLEIPALAAMEPELEGNFQT